MTSKQTYLSAIILDEDMECSLHDLCRMCNIPAEIVHEMVDEGLIQPIGSEPMQWRFTSIEIRRVQTTLRLQRDLRVNLPGCALVLDLLEELQELRRRNRIG